jgi:hypothetical protein
MRLGKTPLVINEFELFSRDYDIKRLIVVCPNTFKQGWAEEANKSASSVPWFVWGAQSEKALLQELSKTGGAFAIAVNYEAIRTDPFKNFCDAWLSGSMLVFDESIKLKNHASDQTVAALSIAKEAKVVRNLSGLPVTQGPQDLYPQFRVIGLFNGYNFYAYRTKYCKMGGFKSKKIVGVLNEEKLKGILNSCSFVAKQKDWSKPGVPQYFTEKLVLSDVQKKHYAEMHKEMQTMLETGYEITVDMVVTKLMKLQQISSGFIYDKDKKAHKLEELSKTPKARRLLEFFEETDSKVIIVYHYSHSGDALLEMLKDYHPAVIRDKEWMKVHGTSADEEKARFNNDPNCRVILLQVSSGKYGHDLTGSPSDRCRVMIFYENTYSLDDRVQIEARNTTAFQDWVNTYHDFVCSSVEMAALTALINKTSVAESVIGEIRKGSNSNENA